MNETEASFMDRCVPMVLADGATETDEQAVAMCFSIFKEKKSLRERLASWFIGKKK